MVEIAVVGIGCRFPGGVDSPQSYWDFLIGKGDGIVDIPADRWNVDKYYDPDPDAPGRAYTRRGGFLSQPLWDFDPEFFGISPREGSLLDPQQRLLLEVAWEALDDAGAAGRVSGQPVGVYVGGFTNDSMGARLSAQARPFINAHSSMASSFTLLSNRISFALDLQGPSMTIDTACSSSLVAFHEATQAIERGECEAALVGGVTVMTQPETFISMCKGRFLAFDGRSKSFDASADGYGRGEGVGMVLIKPLEAALRDRDRIYSVVRGTGSNQDGRTIALPVPNPVSQERLARRVYAEAGIDPAQVGYVEAHGTGTSVGDPLEMKALGGAYGAVPGRTTPLPVGSVKAAIGHTEAAAGIASVIKASLTVYHKQIAPQSWLENLNPEIPFDDLKLRVPVEPEPFPDHYEKAIVAVNGFGYGGTNAHVILEEPPAQAREYLKVDDASPISARSVNVFPVSGRTEAAARELAAALADQLADGANLAQFVDAAWTRRAHHLARTAFAFTDREDLEAQLREFASGEGRAAAHVLPEGPVDPVFVFSGMGPQWWAMGRALLQEGGVFAEEAARVDAEFQPIAGWSIIEELLREEDSSRVTKTEIAQPANFLIQVSLVAELKVAGIRPSAVVGHSVGEVAAAYISGALSLHDALLVSYHRARLQATTAGSGGMLAVGLSETDVAPWIPGDGSISIAAINSPSAVTLAGSDDAVDVLAEQLTNEGIFARKLKVEVPYHSHLMDPILGEIAQTLAPLQPSAPAIPLYSTVTAAPVTEATWGAEYWCENVRQPVRFADTATAMIGAGHRVFLEVGPHPVLSGNLREIFVRTGDAGASVPTLVREADDRGSLLKTLCNLYIAGALHTAVAPSFDVCTAESPIPFLPLPRYPFQRQRMWNEPEVVALARHGDPNAFSMLGDRSEPAEDHWRIELASSQLPWLRDHVVDSLVLLPGAAYIDAALSAAATRTGRDAVSVQDIRFVAPLVIDEHSIPVLELIVEPTTRRFTLRSKPIDETNWTTNAFGRLVEGPLHEARSDTNAPADAYRVQGSDLYTALAARGLQYGPAFQGIVHADVASDRVVAQLDLSHLTGGHYTAHPAAVDTALQCVALLAGPESGDGAVVPAAVGTIHRFGPLPQSPIVVVQRTGTAPLRARIDIVEATDNGEPGRVALSMNDVVFAPVSPPPSTQARLGRLFYEPEWEPRDERDITAATADVAGDYALIFAFGEQTAQRAEQIAQSRPHSQIVTIASVDGLDQVAADAITASVAVPQTTSTTAIILAAPEWSPEDNTYGVVSVARGATWALGLADDSDGHKSASALKAVIVAERAFCLPSDRDPANPAATPLAGARRSLANEQPQLAWRLVDAEPGTFLSTLLAEIVGIGTYDDDDADEVALREGTRWVLRMRRSYSNHLDAFDVARPLTDTEANFEIEAPASRLLSDLALREVSRREPGPGEVEIKIDAIGLNYKDPLKVMGVLTEKELDGTYYGTSLALEAGGEVVRVGSGVEGIEVGDRMGIGVPNMGRRYVTTRIDEGNTTKVPHHFKGEQCGSTLPFLTAEFSFTELTRVRPGDTVLVHGAAGGMGLAAVQVAKRLGARVIGSASTPQRRDVALAAGADDVVDSRSVGFADEVMRLTEGRGVDVIYTSAPGEIIAQNLRVAAEFGRIIDIGKADIYTGGVMDLAPFDRNLSFFAVDMDRMMAFRPQIVRDYTNQVVKFLDDGTYTFLPYSSFPLSKIAEAFEAVARSSHTGRVVLMLDEPEPMVRPQIPDANISADASYLVTGGFGAFGLATARWLVNSGARHLVLVGRSGATNDQAREQLQAFTQQGVEVIEERVDVADYDAVAAMIARAAEHSAPLRGIFHTAGIVCNRPIHDITPETLRETFGPKVAGGENLHRATVEYNEGNGLTLDHFVLYSSVSALTGGTPQISYSAANSALDALAQSRQAQGLPGLALSWGAMGGGGMAEANEETVRYLALLGFRPIDMDQATAYVEECLRLDLPHIAIMDIDWEAWGTTNPAGIRNPRFHEHIAAAAAGGEGASALQAEILALPEEQRGEVITFILAEQLAIVMGIPAEGVDLHTPLPDLGMDSLMAVEFAARAGKTLGIEVSALEFGRGSGLSSIGTKMAAVLGDSDRKATAPAAPAAPVEAPVPTPAAADAQAPTEEATVS
ncbi:MAG: SDR family NAD(P)-dependent oxidoreductase [Rhodococcus sp.]|nr:SDR family NAD(P)-dependent oxidoreductase [Rhodococcus sp. (in: high G+C Gram-positive bacteria)]